MRGRSGRRPLQPAAALEIRKGSTADRTIRPRASGYRPPSPAPACAEVHAVDAGDERRRQEHDRGHREDLMIEFCAMLINRASLEQVILFDANDAWSASAFASRVSVFRRPRTPRRVAPDDRCGRKEIAPMLTRLRAFGLQICRLMSRMMSCRSRRAESSGSNLEESVSTPASRSSVWRRPAAETGRRGYSWPRLRPTYLQLLVAVAPETACFVFLTVA